MHVLTQDGVPWRTLPDPIHPASGTASKASAWPGLHPLPERTATVQRRVSSRGSIQVAHQRIQAGMAYAGKIVTVVTENNSFRLVIDGDTAGVVPAPPATRSAGYRAHATPSGRR